MKFFDCKIKTRYAETDQMGVCYYANYLIWFEVARTDFFDAIGLPYKEFEENGIFLPVAEAYCRYRQPIFYNDRINVKVYVTKLKRTSIQFSYIVLKDKSADIVAEGHTTHVFVDKNMTPRRIPKEICEKVEVVDKEDMSK